MVTSQGIDQRREASPSATLATIRRLPGQRRGMGHGFSRKGELEREHGKPNGTNVSSIEDLHLSASTKYNFLSLFKFISFIHVILI